MTQSVVSRLEDTEYGSVSVNTLLKITKENNMALDVSFTDYNTLLQKDISSSALKIDNIFENYRQYKHSMNVTGPVATKPAYATSDAVLFVVVNQIGVFNVNAAQFTGSRGVTPWQNLIPQPQQAARNSSVFETPNIVKSMQTPA